MACLHPPLNVKLGINFHVVVVQRGQTNVLVKKCDARAELLFC